VAHEYVHFAAHQRNQPRPAWLEEGLAEFYSNFDGRQLGIPIAAHLQLLEKPWLTPEEMNQPRALDQAFYAQSWALVHMLRREAQFPEKVTQKMLDDLRLYLKTMRAAPAKTPPVPAPIASAETISPLNALLLRADLALHSRKPALARDLYTQASKAYPDSSAVETGLGTLAYNEGDPVKALAHLRRALELNDRDALAWFELSLLENDQAALEKAVQLNPNLAEAHVLLGVRLTDDGNLDAALQHLEQATRLLPRKSYAWYSLGYAQFQRGDVAGARGALEQALQTASTQEQRQMAATLLDSLPGN
jgi:tetratricopeptide (TPR) repeat protein